VTAALSALLLQIRCAPKRPESAAALKPATVPQLGLDELNTMKTINITHSTQPSQPCQPVRA